MAESFFDNRASSYDRLINWDKRLANESPFLKTLFDEYRVQRVLDAACGTGRHAHLLYENGLTVEGADVSEEMIEFCKQQYGQHERLSWNVRSFADPVDSSKPFDAVLCLGNSLLLADDRTVITAAVQAMMGAIQSGGLCIIHVLNIWRFDEGPTTWQKIRRINIADQPHTLIKGIHRAGKRAYIDFLDIPDTDAGEPQTNSNSFEGIEADELEGLALQHGAEQASIYGNHQFQPYERLSSQDIILVAKKK